MEREIEILTKLTVEELEVIAADWEIFNDDLELLAKRRLEWFEEDEDGVDEKGSYQLVTYNPQGKWDSYSFIATEPIESDGFVTYPCRVSELPEVVPYAIVMPNGQWHELGANAGVNAFAKLLQGDLTDSQEEAQWEQRVKEILILHPDNLAIGLRCHR